MWEFVVQAWLKPNIYCNTLDNLAKLASFAVLVLALWFAIRGFVAICEHVDNNARKSR